MKKIVGIATIILAGLIGGCAQTPATDAPVTRVSKDYEAMGDASGIHPFIYGKRTLIEFKNAPFGLTVKDIQGETVSYKKEGKYYALERKLDYFTISSGGRTVAFSLAVPEAPPLGPLVDPKPTEPQETVAVEAPVPLQPTVPQATRQAEPIFKLEREQLHQYRQLLKKAENDERITGDELHALNRKLEGMEKKMDAGIAIVHVYFADHATQPAHDDPTLKTILEDARYADHINIHGRTSAVVAGKRDADIAMSRAQNIKQYLIGHGIKGYRIEVTSLAEGDFIAAPVLKEADRFNRRAAIELIREH